MPLCYRQLLIVLSHILEKKIPVDIGVLCDFMEQLSGSLCMAFRLRANGGNLHDVTLPKSWILRLLPNVTSLSTKDTQLSCLFKHIGDLLEDIYAGRAGKRHDILL